MACVMLCWVQYIEFVADQLATTLGHEKLFKAANPFGWLETIALQ